MSTKKPKSGTSRRASKDRAERRRAHFLELLRETSNIAHSLREAGWDSKSAYEARKKDPELARQWDEAIDQGVATLEMEARRRALNGVKRGVWHNGERVGEETHFSDTLTIFLLKAHRPEVYRERQQIEHVGDKDQPVIVEYALPSNGRDGS